MKKIAAAILFGIIAATAYAETPQEFADRMKPHKGLHVTVNLREDGSFGSLSIRLSPELLADKSRADPVLAEIGKFAAATKLKADVLTPSRVDSSYVTDKFKEAGVARVSPRVMSETVSNKTSRIFLTPDKP